MATEFFSIFIMWRVSNQSILSLRLASTTADLIPKPFRSGIEEHIPVLLGRIQVPVPALLWHMDKLAFQEPGIQNNAEGLYSSSNCQVL